MPGNAYKFVAWDVPPTPDNATTRLMDKAFGDEPLTREEKDRIAERLYGLFGAGGSTHKLGGWAWPMARAKQVRRILVRHKNDSVFRECYAPDKSSLRKALPTVAEMIYVRRRDERTGAGAR